MLIGLGKLHPLGLHFLGEKRLHGRKLRQHLQVLLEGALDGPLRNGGEFQHSVAEVSSCHCGIFQCTALSVLFILSCLPVPFSRLGMVNFRRFLVFARRWSMDALCCPSRLVKASDDSPSSFRAMMRIFSSCFSIPTAWATFLSSIFQKE
jgi:hypothetical protein